MFFQLLASSSNSYLSLLFILICSSYLVKIVYRLWFHPLSHFPGPFLNRVSRIPYFFKHCRGTLPFDMLDLHTKYGNIVRIAPDELAFSHPDAWEEIMGHKKGNKEFAKAPWFYHPVEGEPTHIVNEERELHGRLRRQLAHGFSERSMLEQEHLIQKYVALMLEKLGDQCKANNLPVIISEWYNYCTFDIIGDLAFGEPFGCLESGRLNMWIRGIFESGRLGTILQALSFLPRVKKLVLSLTSTSARAAHELHQKATQQKMVRRMEMGHERSDLINGLLVKQQDLELSLAQLIANAEILIIGGSETTATLLSGLTYLILNRSDVLDTLKNEVRSSFSSEEQISLTSVGRLDYMTAVLKEALRMYPPIANGLPRIVPAGGATILGQHIPAKTYVSIHHWALYRREDYFKDANCFRPERFLGMEQYEHDRRDALQPFHVGPRSCLGRNLAYHESRLILARLLYRFDLELAAESSDWIHQKNFLMWQKGPLKVYLSQVQS